MEKVIDRADQELRAESELRLDCAGRTIGQQLHANAKNAEAFVVGPDGERLTRADLPEADTRRWVPRRKARVVAAVEGGLVSREWALERYRLTSEEFDSWKSGMARFGMRGLCVTKLGRSRGAGK